jgi:hypothetical protein
VFDRHRVRAVALMALGRQWGRRAWCSRTVAPLGLVAPSRSGRPARASTRPQWLGVRDRYCKEFHIEERRRNTSICAC